MTDTHENLIKNTSESQVIFDGSEDVEETDEDEESLSPSVLKEDLTIIKGIGAKSAAILNRAEITSIEQLSNYTAEELSKVNGIGLASARKMIEGAKSHLETLSLDNFSQPEIQPSHILQEEEQEEPFEEFEDNEQLEDKISSPMVDNGEISYERIKSKVKKELVEKDFKLTLDASTPIVVDGSNVAWMGVDRDTGGFPKIEYLIGLIKKLEDIGLMDIAIFIDPGLHRKIDDPDKLESMINSGKIHRVGGRGKKEKDDHYVLNYARIKDAYIIVESELYRNFSRLLPDKYPRRWIEERRIEVKIVNGAVMFTPEIEIYESSKKKAKNNTKSQVEPWFDPKDRIKREESHIYPSKPSQSDIEEPTFQEYKEKSVDLEEEYDNRIPEEIDVNVHETNEVELEEDIPREIETLPLIEPPVTITHDVSNINMAVLNHQEMQGFSQETCTFLRENEFHIIQKDSELQKVYHGIDILALKVIRIKETREVICVIPIKLNNVRGPLIVSLDKITSNAKGDNASPAINRKLDSYATTLSNACIHIRDNLGDEGTLFAYINNNLELNLTLERTRTHKNLYFRSGLIQYKLVVTPLLVSQHKVGFTEKVLSFAYQKDLDLHVVELMNFSHILQYLDLKYFQIETYNKEKSAITIDNEGSVKLMTLVRKSSMIFLGIGLIGITLLVFALFQGFSVLGIVNNLGYGAIILYAIILGYFYLANFRRKSLIHRKFETPYHKRNLNLDDASLVLIREDLPPELMEQFVYESLGTRYKSKVITNINVDGAQDFIRKKSLEKEVDEDTLFEKKGKNKEELNLDGSLPKKFVSFMED